MTKTQQHSLLKAVKNLLYARRSSNVPREQVAYNKLHKISEKLGIDISLAITQGQEYLKKHSIAANMNGIV